MGSVVWFSEDGATRRDLVGGKGANLGLLTAAGFAVPPGFVVATEAYRLHLEAIDSDPGIATLVDGIDYDEPRKLEEATAAIRALIIATPLAAASRSAIADAYRSLSGTNGAVAVRSSGTAEDTAEASFAGLHDTFLDVRGEEVLFESIRACWASLWTARATRYRHDKGFDHLSADLAVVVQAMVDSECAGVMFTANPLTGATDEVIVNASWGLGESVVSGLVTPDEFVLAKATLDLRRTSIGDKTAEIIRDVDAPSGVVTRDVDPARRLRPSLSEDQLRRLGQMGKRVEDHYGQMPQDVEWALADGEFFLLQSRDVTGVELSWDDEVDGWQDLPDDPSYVWTRRWADEYWTGPITPLFYSIRGEERQRIHTMVQKRMGNPELARMRLQKYRKAEVYWNANFEKEMVATVLPKSLRTPAVMAKTPSSWWDEIAEAPFSVRKYLNIYARTLLLEPEAGPTKWIGVVYEHLDHNTTEGDGKSDAELADLTDRELRRYALARMDLAVEMRSTMWTAFFVYGPGMLSLLGDWLARWYTGQNPHAFSDLVSGLPKQSVTLRENEELWKMAGLIRADSVLASAFDAWSDGAFLEKVDEIAGAEEFARRYAAFKREHGHRGQADRDMWYPNRFEDPAIDYRSLKVILTSDSDRSPAEREEQMKARREAATDEVVENLRRQPLGLMKAEAFKVLLSQLHRFLTVRDDERHFVDRLAWSMKRTMLEVNRRILERDLLDGTKDFYFLAIEELFDVLESRHDPRRVRAKIAGRRENFERFDRKEITPPLYMRNGETVELDRAEVDAGDEGGKLVGMGTSPGLTTGPARIVRSLTELDRVSKGDILVCQATDPGWTPAFLVISGLVLETGGMLAHGSCLSREYGLPAVQVRDAMSLIKDGQVITVDGAAGAVLLEDQTNSPAVATANSTPSQR
jgi:rifampicin phosphotransferase